MIIEFSSCLLWLIIRVQFITDKLQLLHLSNDRKLWHSFIENCCIEQRNFFFYVRVWQNINLEQDLTLPAQMYYCFRTFEMVFLAPSFKLFQIL